MKIVETDSESGAEIFQLVDDPRPADNIYGEQPYSSADGSRVTIRFYPEGDQDGGLSLLDLNDQSLHPVLTESPRFPAFHAWGEHLYYQQKDGDALVLKRCNYQSLEKEDITALPTQEGRFSYGSTSQDHRYYAASVHPEGGSSKVWCIDLSSGQAKTLAQRDDYHFKHEQFSLDGNNRILIQANKMPDVDQVRLGALEPGEEGITWYPVDRPHTPRPTGHEAWIGQTDTIFISTGTDEDSQGNMWTAGLHDEKPHLVSKSGHIFSHVSVSHCGNYWIGDVTREPNVPIHIGSLSTGAHKRIVFSGTDHDGQQWSHTHPYLTADNRWLIYTSNRSGHPQVYGAKIPKGFLENL
jgi:hypothetical protein